MARDRGFDRIRRFSFGDSSSARELDQEFAHHLDSVVQELVDEGMTRPAARAEAERRFGNLERHREDCRRIERRMARTRQRGEFFGELIHDLRFAFRSLRKSPVFAFGVVVTLALGIGVNTSIFSVVHGVLLEPLPYPQPERLVHLWESNPLRGWTRANASGSNFLDWRDESSSFEDLTAHSYTHKVSLSGAGEPEVLRGVRVFGNFFDLMGVPPLHGRGFTEAESWTGTEPVVVLSHSLWQRRFAGDPEVIGTSVNLDGNPATVVGVMPEGFSYPWKGLDLWQPQAWKPEFRNLAWFRRAHFLGVTGRLKEGVSLARADAELGALAARLEEKYPETNEGMGAGLTPLREWLVGDSRKPLGLLLVAVSLVLLIACANVAHLYLVRAAPRQGELALRRALGAGRGRLLRQLLTESLCLAMAGGLAGCLLGYLGIEALLAMAPRGLPRVEEISLSWPVLAYTFGVSLLAGLLCGLQPALRGSLVRGAQLSHQRQAGSGPGQRRSRAALVTAEVALAVVLVVGAGLLLRSFVLLRAVDLGFKSPGLLVAQIGLPAARYADDTQVMAFWQRLLARLEALPGVSDAGVVNHLPLHGKTWTNDFQADGWPEERIAVGFNRRVVGPNYHKTMGVPLLAGRHFEAGDDGNSTEVVLVNEHLARRHFPEGNVVGRRIRYTSDLVDPPPWRTIVGVVGAEQLEGLASEMSDEVFMPMAQLPQREVAVVLRSAGDPRMLTPALRQVVQDLDPELAISDAGPMDDVVSQAAGRERFLVFLLGTFAGCALLLAMVGIYGTVAYGVAQRQRELGVRAALGARAQDLVRAVLSEGVGSLAAGLALGLAGALLCGRWLQSMLYGVRSGDPLTLGAVCVLLTLTLLAACYIPARRVSRIDPARTLREDGG